MGEQVVSCPHCGKALSVVSGIDAALLHAVRQAAKANGISPDEVMRRCRRVRFVRARHHVFRLLRDQGFSYTEIGEATGYDHSTIQYALKRSRAAAATRVIG